MSESVKAVFAVMPAGLLEPTLNVGLSLSKQNSTSPAPVFSL